MSFVAVRSYSKKYTSTMQNLNGYLAEGYEVVMVTPFIGCEGETEYLEYILKKPEQQLKSDYMSNATGYNYNVGIHR